METRYLGHTFSYNFHFLLNFAIAEEKSPPECAICEETLGRILKQKEFCGSDKNQDEDYTCPHCPKSFHSYLLAYKHAKNHHFERKFECQICLKSFAAADKLKMHSLTHSDKRYCTVKTIQSISKY